MIRIRPAQLQALQKVQDDGFPAAVAAHLRASHPDLVKAVSGERLLRRVQKAIAVARRYRIEPGDDGVFFIVLLFRVGSGLLRHPFSSAILRDVRRPGADRLHELVEEMTEEQWAEAARAHDPAFWS